jgi:hypothetical protein
MCVDLKNMFDKLQTIPSREEARKIWSAKSKFVVWWFQMLRVNNDLSFLFPL